MAKDHQDLSVFASGFDPMKTRFESCTSANNLLRNQKLQHILVCSVTLRMKEKWKQGEVSRRGENKKHSGVASVSYRQQTEKKNQG